MKDLVFYDKSDNIKNFWAGFFVLLLPMFLLACFILAAISMKNYFLAIFFVILFAYCIIILRRERTAAVNEPQLVLKITNDSFYIYDINYQWEDVKAIKIEWVIQRDYVLRRSDIYAPMTFGRLIKTFLPFFPILTFKLKGSSENIEIPYEITGMSIRKVYNLMTELHKKAQQRLIDRSQNDLDL